jgi:hypothetical protein
MSVTFESPSIPSDVETGEGQINVSNVNACDILRWLDIPLDGPDGLLGSISARELAARCRRRLWDIPQNHDEGLAATDSGENRLFVIEPDGSQRLVAGEPGPRVIFGGRPPGYLRQKTKQLLELAEKAGDGVITWG